MYDQHHIVNPNLENGCHYSFEDTNNLMGIERASQQEYESEKKVFSMNSISECHDKQIQRLQRDQSKRIEDYNFIRQKLETSTQDLQAQIKGIRAELTNIHLKTAQMSAVQQRLIQCEERNVSMQIHNDTEFEILKDVLKRVCGRMDDMEELQQREREHLQMQNYQHHQEATLAASLLETPVASPNFPQSNKPQILSARVKCLHCHKKVCRSYLKKHQETVRCQVIRTTL